MSLWWDDGSWDEPGSSWGSGVVIWVSPFHVSLCSPVCVDELCITKPNSDTYEFQSLEMVDKMSSSLPKCCRTSHSLWCLEHYTWKSLHSEFQKNKYDPLLSKQKISLFDLLLSEFWLIPEQVFSQSGIQHCWRMLRQTAMSAPNLWPLGKCW